MAFIKKFLGVTPAELTGNNTISTDKTELLTEFRNVQDAMEFILKTPTLAAYGGCDSSSMSDETIVDIANEILLQLKLVSYKYKNF